MCLNDGALQVNALMQKNINNTSTWSKYNL